MRVCVHVYLCMDARPHQSRGFTSPSSTQQQIANQQEGQRFEGSEEEEEGSVSVAAAQMALQPPGGGGGGGGEEASSMGSSISDGSGEEGEGDPPAGFVARGGTEGQGGEVAEEMKDTETVQEPETVPQYPPYV